MLPDFIIIGGMKCGTTSLYHYLSLHPEVGMSDIKEVDYFIAENNFEKGVKWYETRFKGDIKRDDKGNGNAKRKRQGKGKSQVFGEASPNYTKAHYFEGVPGRMHDLLPDVQLIYLVRDPVDRIISHYTHNLAEGREQKPIDEALKDLKDNHYAMCSRYFWQLEHYLQYYPREQILVVKSSDLMDNRKKTLQKIFRFIGADDCFYTVDFEYQKHRTGKKRKKGKTARRILESPIIKILKGFIPDALKDPVKRATRPKVKKPDINPLLKQKLHDYFRPDIEALADFTGEDFSV
jgi:hypothetical protein